MIELPNWIEREVWDAFEDMRKKMRKPLTDYARKLAVKKLLALYVEDNRNVPNDVLEQSIMCGYQGLWPIHSSRTSVRDSELRVGQGPIVRRFE